MQLACELHIEEDICVALLTAGQHGMQGPFMSPFLFCIVPDIVGMCQMAPGICLSAAYTYILVLLVQILTWCPPKGALVKVMGMVTQ